MAGVKGKSGRKKGVKNKVVENKEVEQPKQEPIAEAA